MKPNTIGIVLGAWIIAWFILDEFQRKPGPSPYIKLVLGIIVLALSFINPKKPQKPN